MITGETIVCISSIDWDSNWQVHQEVTSAFADAGNDVLFIENTGVRRPGLRDWPRLRQRARNWRRSSNGLRAERDRLHVFSPLVLPFPYSRAARLFNRTLLARTYAAWAGTRRRPPILWTFLPTPVVADLQAVVRPALTIYYCVDDFASSSPGAVINRRS